jgi:hypothetical protein
MQFTACALAEIFPKSSQVHGGIYRRVGETRVSETQPLGDRVFAVGHEHRDILQCADLAATPGVVSAHPINPEFSEELQVFPDLVLSIHLA